MEQKQTQFEKDMSPEIRNKEIGGSDAGTIMGMNKWKGVHELWQEKRGLLEPEPQNIPMAVGHVMEPLVASLYGGHVGFINLTEPDKYTHREHSWMVGHIDRLVEPYEGQKGDTYGLECKTANPFNVHDWGEQGSDEVPKSYYIQVMHYMAVTGLPYFDIAVLIGNNDFRVYRVHKNDDIINAMIEKECQFMEWVKDGTEPPIDASESSRQYILSKHPNHKEGTEIFVADDEEVMEHIQAFVRYKKEMKDAEQTMKFAKNQIMDFMGDNSRLTCSDGYFLFKRNKSSIKVDHKALCADPRVKISDEIEQEYTTNRPGARVFRPYFK